MIEKIWYILEEYDVVFTETVKSDILNFELHYQIGLRTQTEEYNVIVFTETKVKNDILNSKPNDQTWFTEMIGILWTVINLWRCFTYR